MDDLGECGGMCVIYGSQTGGGKKWEEGKKRCWWLPDWEVEGVVAAEKRFVGGCPIRKSSRSDGKKMWVVA